MAPQKKQIQLTFLDSACNGLNLFPGSWKRGPHEQSRYKDNLDYYINAAKLAEKGKITAIFYADNFGTNDVYKGNTDAAYRSGSQVASHEPLMAISAMAAVTKSVGFVVTANAIHLSPYLTARSFSTLDHYTKGRFGWNIVTGYTNASARAMGHEKIMNHDERYEKAREFCDLEYRFWEGSWDDDAKVWDVENDTAYDPARIRPVDHQGQYFSVFNTPSAVHPSPQRTPALFQAGVSKAGLAFAAENAEGIFCASFTPERVATYTKSIRERAVELGRDPQDIKFFPGVTLFVAPTLEEAQAKFDAVAALATPEAGLAKFGGFTSIDCSKYPMDEPFEFEETDADNQAKGSILSFKDEKQGTWTPRKLGLKMALGSTYPNIIGTPEMVCDELERWVEVGDVDGFSLYTWGVPGAWEDVVEYVVPELQRRGVYWLDYPVPGGTLRENMSMDPGRTRIPDAHPAAKYRRERQADRARRDAAEKANGVSGAATNGHVEETKA